MSSMRIVAIGAFNMWQNVRASIEMSTVKFTLCSQLISSSAARVSPGIHWKMLNDRKETKIKKSTIEQTFHAPTNTNSFSEIFTSNTFEFVRLYLVWLDIIFCFDWYYIYLLCHILSQSIILFGINRKIVGKTWEWIRNTHTNIHSKCPTKTQSGTINVRSALQTCYKESNSHDLCI